MKPTAWIFALTTVAFGAGAATIMGLARVTPQKTESTEHRYTLATVARHARADDCWMVIDGQVYDLTAYIPQHPTAPSIVTTWCGQEATQAYHTKMLGRPHSPFADSLLPKYRIGTLTQ